MNSEKNPFKFNQIRFKNVSLNNNDKNESVDNVFLRLKQNLICRQYQFPCFENVILKNLDKIFHHIIFI